MYVFSRSARLGPGRTRESMAWAVNVTEKVNQISETEFTCWASVFSPGVGTLAWSTVVENLAELEATEAKLLADDVYVSLLDEGAAFGTTDPIDDALLQILHGDIDPNAPTPTYANSVAAVLDPANSVRGVELGVEIAQRATQITGKSTMFGLQLTGPYGGVEWITTYDSIEELQAANDAINADEAFAQTLQKEASKAYVVGSATQLVFRRMV